MLDKFKRKPKPKSNLKCRTNASGGGKIWNPPLQSQSKVSECSLFALKKINGTSHELRVSVCFLSGQRAAGNSFLAILSRGTQFRQPYLPNIAVCSNDAYELWNEAVQSNGKIISKNENLNEQLTGTEPVGFICVK